jgi:hypothetical protein
LRCVEDGAGDGLLGTVVAIQIAGTLEETVKKAEWSRKDG